jgi:hypothetical protein
MSASQFDPEVVALMRAQFDEGDKDSSGEVDAEEAAALFSRHFNPDSSEAEIRRSASSLKNEIDTDRNGRISFDEYCFRFGRRYQMDAARRRRGKLGAQGRAKSYEETVNSKAWKDDDARQARAGTGSGFGYGTAGGIPIPGADQLILFVGCAVVFYLLLG